ncbi:Uncharacterized protein GBIM_06988 [Gryllus bimaculatus]|nr:Uncharacterized protein GBIM_06988 [Gryllus bimaculatus]
MMAEQTRAPTPSVTVVESEDEQVAQVFNDPHVKGIQLVKEVTISGGKTVKVVGPPVEYSEAENCVRLPPPALGEHTDDVLKNILDYSEEKIKELKQKNEKCPVTLQIIPDFYQFFKFPDFFSVFQCFTESGHPVKLHNSFFYLNISLVPDTIQDVRTVRLTLRKPKTRKAVQWTTGTVDNEHLNRKKSKCCCQYTKPKAFDESSSSSSSDEECEHCFGHVEKKKKKHSQGDTPNEECDHHHHHAPESPDQSNEEQDGGCTSSSQNGGENS